MESRKHTGDANTRWCPDCQAFLPVEQFYFYGGKRPRRAGYCKDHTNERSRIAHAARRDAVLEILGKVCIRCGFSDVRALQIDHVNGGGTAEYAALGNPLIKLLALVMEHLNDYQILCANCNWIKKAENEEVPRKRKGVPSSL